MESIEDLKAENARLRAKIDAALALTDTGSPEFKERYERQHHSGVSLPVKWWRVVEAIRETLLGA